MKTLPNDLDNFTGTEQYHKVTLSTRIKATDGIAHLCQEVGCFWLMDIVASVQNLPKVMEHSNFLIWRVISTGNKGVVEAHWDCEEGGGYDGTKLVYKQSLTYTDFPEGEFEFYQQGDVVLLKSEH